MFLVYGGNAITAGHTGLDAMSLIFKDHSATAADNQFIVDNEDIQWRHGNYLVSAISCDRRNLDQEPGPSAEFAVDLDLSLMLVNDAITHGKP